MLVECLRQILPTETQANTEGSSILVECQIEFKKKQGSAQRNNEINTCASIGDKVRKQ